MGRPSSSQGSMISQSHLVLPFLGFPLRRKVDQALISDLLRTPLSPWASVLDQNLTPPSVPSPGLTHSRPLAWAVVFRVCMAQACWLVKLLFPPSWCGLASQSPCTVLTASGVIPLGSHLWSSSFRLCAPFTVYQTTTY